ncbi:hypothetical protein ABBQ32_012796 [Trebouxia sp. C0010 RCD-2024]
MLRRERRRLPPSVQRLFSSTATTGTGLATGPRRRRLGVGAAVLGFGMGCSYFSTRQQATSRLVCLDIPGLSCCVLLKALDLATSSSLSCNFTQTAEEVASPPRRSAILVPDLDECGLAEDPRNPPVFHADACSHSHLRAMCHG